MKKILTIMLAVLLGSIATQAQLFRPLGLGDGLGKHIYSNFRPRMHVEGDNLYVCTNQGLYCKDLSDDTSQWQMAGFEGIPLQDYARNENGILALRHNVDSCFLLLSHDGGRTYQDITSSELVVDNPSVKNVLLRLVQHPDDPNTLLVMSNHWGVYRSTDFGQTWSKMDGLSLAGSSIGYHPARPEIIYNTGSNDADEPGIDITYDGGQTWKCVYPHISGFYAYNISFDPSNPDRWILGGDYAISTSDDNGQSWDAQNFNMGDQLRASWQYPAFDNEQPNIVYIVGRLGSDLKVMCSIDGGRSWLTPQAEPDQLNVNDVQQYGDKLLIYTDSDIYELSKADLLAQSSVQNLKYDDAEGSSEIYDLQGRKVTQPTQPGIYIHQGKKVVVK